MSSVYSTTTPVPASVTILPVFVPPFYRNIGKTTTDLLKKKYEYDHTLKILNTSSPSLSLESGAVFTETGLRGYVKPVYRGSKYGRFESTITTDPNHESNASFAFSKLPVGLSVKTSVSSKDKDKTFKRPVGAVDVEYQTNYFNGGVKVKSDLDIHKAEAHAALGADGITLGAHTVLDVTSGAEIQELNYGVEYSQADYVCSGFTEKNAKFLNFTYFQRVSPVHALGALFKSELSGKQERALSIGSEYRVDRDTLVKTKIDLPTGDISSHIEHRLAVPRVLIGLASSFSFRNQTVTAQKVGLTLTVGDF